MMSREDVRRERVKDSVKTVLTMTIGEGGLLVPNCVKSFMDDPKNRL
jgi:hypothetical protein